MYLLILSDLQLLEKAILSKNEKISRVSSCPPFTVENWMEVYEDAGGTGISKTETHSIWGILSLEAATEYQLSLAVSSGQFRKQMLMFQSNDREMSLKW